MSKKDYEKLAWLIGQYVMPLSMSAEAGMTQEKRRIGVHLFLSEIVLWLMDDNSRFDSEKFCKAVMDSVDEILGNQESGSDEESGSDDGIMTNGL